MIEGDNSFCVTQSVGENLIQTVLQSSVGSDGDSKVNVVCLSKDRHNSTVVLALRDANCLVELSSAFASTQSDALGYLGLEWTRMSESPAIFVSDWQLNESSWKHLCLRESAKRFETWCGLKGEVVETVLFTSSFVVIKTPCGFVRFYSPRLGATTACLVFTPISLDDFSIVRCFFLTDNALFKLSTSKKTTVLVKFLRYVTVVNHWIFRVVKSKLVGESHEPIEIQDVLDFRTPLEFAEYVVAEATIAAHAVNSAIESFISGSRPVLVRVQAQSMIFSWVIWQLGVGHLVLGTCRGELPLILPDIVSR